ncbi:MAG: M48 family metallopeptidase, partial [Candidatus Binatia bacterium]
MQKIRSFVLALFPLLLSACATAPITGRSQFLIVSESQEVSLGEEAYRHILRDSVLSRQPDALRIVRKVGERIARVANKPNYQWEFRVIDDPEMANAFAVPGGKVAVYTGIFPAARDEAGLAVILAHEVAHAIARHAAERMSHGMLVQLGGLGLSAALGSNPQLANQVLQAYGLGTGVGLILPFSRSQELEADRIGLIFMAKAGYDPSVALEVWERMGKKEFVKDQDSPPEFLSTHPGYERRAQQLRSWIPEALKFYRPSKRSVELLPSLRSLDSPAGRAERELLKRVRAVNQQAGDPRGERAVLEALGHLLRIDPSILRQERQRLQLGYGQHAALRGVSFLGRTSLRQVVLAYEHGSSWTDMTQRYGTR